MQKVCLIQLYLGPLPPWTGVFLHTLACNTGFHILCITDHEIPVRLSVQLRHVRTSRNDLKERIRAITGISNELMDPRKICDFKPAFGDIFEDYLGDYDWWGYCDNDMIFGSLDHFLLPEYFEKYDVISTYPGYLSGPFCLYRNEPDMNNMYRGIPGFERILEYPDCLGFDENLLDHPARRNWLDWLEFPFFYAGRCLQSVLFRPGLEECRYQYHWKIKKRQIKRHGVRDMTDQVFALSSEGKVRPGFLELLISDTSFQRRGQKNWKLVWENGILRETFSNKELFAFHFRKMKAALMQMEAPLQEDLTRFELDKNGFRF